MRTIPVALQQELNLIYTTGVYAWLFEIQLDKGRQGFRFTSNVEPITFDSRDYQPFPIRLETVTENSQGDLPTTVLQVGNVSAEIVQYLQAFDGLSDEVVIVRTVNTNHIADPTAVIERRYAIRACNVTDVVASVELGPPSVLTGAFPKRGFARNHCPFRFGSPECGWGYSPGVPGLAPPAAVGNVSESCDKTEDGPNGCIFHGQLYETAPGGPYFSVWGNGWPERGGFFTLIPKRRGP